MDRRKQKRKPEVSKSVSRAGWPEVIALVQEKIGRIDVKKAQLSALLAVFQRQQAAGDPSPFEVLERK